MKKQNTWLWLPVLLGMLLFIGGLVDFESRPAFAKPDFGTDCQSCHGKTKQELLKPTPTTTTPTTKPATPINPRPKKAVKPHKAGFLATHGSEVINKGASSCINCHKTTNFCSSCHRKTVQPASWDLQHKNVKNYADKLSCSQCHPITSLKPQ